MRGEIKKYRGSFSATLLYRVTPAQGMSLLSHRARERPRVDGTRPRVAGTRPRVETLGEGENLLLHSVAPR